MKKVFKKSLSLLLAVSALCILFAFPASAVTTQCPLCSAYTIYTPLPMDQRHECACPNHGTFYEEDCEVYDYDEDRPNKHFCACGRDMGYHVYGYEYVDLGDHHLNCCECGLFVEEGHTYVDGVCVCGHVQ